MEEVVWTGSWGARGGEGGGGGDWRVRGLGGERRGGRLGGRVPREGDAAVVRGASRRFRKER